MNNKSIKLLISSVSLVMILFCNACRKQINITSQKNTSVRNANSLSIKILSHNVFLLQSIFFSPTTLWNQFERAVEIAKAGYLEDYDVLLLQECFDYYGGQALAHGLLTRFPYQTPIMGKNESGWDRTDGYWRDNPLEGSLENGGCMIASKYPITFMAQYIYPRGCSYDGYALKGFIYAQIKKDGQIIHFFNTHLQSTQSHCKGTESSYRTIQLKLLKNYIDDLNIPKTEMVVLGGDFNIDKGTVEYKNMLKILHVSEPHYAGIAYTWDPGTNAMVAYHFPFHENEPEYLDYVFVSDDHWKPPVWQNLVLDPVSSTLMGNKNLLKNEFYWVEYSDHYPVAAFIYADDKTPTHSLRFRPYDKVSLRSVATGKYVKSNLNYPRDWLQVSAGRQTMDTWFNLTNITKADNSYFKVKPGIIRVESAVNLNHYWYWTHDPSGPYYYYPEFGIFSPKLTLEIISKKEGNTNTYLEDGDIVSFKDYDNYYYDYPYYIQTYQKSGKYWLYLNGYSPGNWEQFQVIFNQKEPDSWKSQLIYK